MPFDIFATVRLPATTSLDEIQVMINRLGKRIEELPGVQLRSRLVDAGPERVDMSPEQKKLFFSSQRIIPYAGPPDGTAAKTIMGGLTALALPIMRPTMIPTSPRIGFTIEVAPGCDPLVCRLGYLDPSLVPQPQPGMEAMIRAFCPSGWQGSCLVISESAMESDDGGIPNAVAAHLAAIGVLDRMREVGFDLRVTDQGDFHTTRDITHLVQTLNQVRDYRIGQGQADIAGLLERLTQALGEAEPRLEQITGPTPESAARLVDDPDAIRRAQAEERILNLLGLVDRTPRCQDRDPDLDAVNQMLGL